jgi:hypothetical protein
MDPPEPVLSVIDRLYCWEGRKPGETVILSYIGQLRLTPRRVIFLSTGTNGIARAALAQLIGGGVAQLAAGQTATEHLDMSALANPGSLNVPLQRIHRSWVGRRWDFCSYLVLEMLSAPDFGVALATRYGLMSRGKLLAFSALLERTRAALSHSADHSTQPASEIGSRPSGDVQPSLDLRDDRGNNAV